MGHVTVVFKTDPIFVGPKEMEKTGYLDKESLKKGTIEKEDQELCKSCSLRCFVLLPILIVRMQTQ